MGTLNKRKEAHLKRKRRVRKSIFGTEERPRLSVFRSARHMYAQVVVDATGHSLAAASTLEKAAREKIDSLYRELEESRDEAASLVADAEDEGIIGTARRINQSAQVLMIQHRITAVARPIPLILRL